MNTSRSPKILTVAPIPVTICSNWLSFRTMRSIDFRNGCFSPESIVRSSVTARYCSDASRSAFGKGNVILLSRNHAITDERREMSPTLSRGLANISSSMREPPLVRVESYMAKIDVFLLRENIPRSSSVCLSIIKLIYPNSYIFPTSAFPF